MNANINTVTGHGQVLQICLQHRLAILFYRAWANAQSITSLDKMLKTASENILPVLTAFNIPTTHNKGLIHEFAKRYFSGLLIKQSRSAVNLQQLLTRYFQVPVNIQTNVGYWVKVEEEKTQIGIMGNYTLGDGLLLGDKLYDVQSKFPDYYWPTYLTSLPIIL